MSSYNPKTLNTPKWGIASFDDIADLCTQNLQGMASDTRILLADDHKLVAEGLKNLIQTNNAGVVLGIACSIAECEQLLSELHPQLLLLDIGMPDGNALDHLPRWQKLYPDMRVLVFSCYGESSVIQRALSHGANGYVQKDSSSAEFLQGIEQVSGGGSYLCPISKEIINKAPKRQQDVLTPREREVLALIVEGLSMKQIAERLFLSFETIHSYTKILRAKLGVNNTAALVRKAIEQKLV